MDEAHEIEALKHALLDTTAKLYWLYHLAGAIDRATCIELINTFNQNYQLEVDIEMVDLDEFEHMTPEMFADGLEDV